MRVTVKALTAPSLTDIRTRKIAFKSKKKNFLTKNIAGIKKARA
jgi:hypothetical protein